MFASCTDLYSVWQRTLVYFIVWHKLQEELGTQLDLSIAFHLQTNGQSECTIQTLEDMLRACAVYFFGS